MIEKSKKCNFESKTIKLQILSKTIKLQIKQVLNITLNVFGDHVYFSNLIVLRSRFLFLSVSVFLCIEEIIAAEV